MDNGYSQDGTTTVFNAGLPNGTYQGIYQSNGGVISPVILPGADLTDTKGHTGPFTFAAIPSAYGGAIAFNGSAVGQSGIYSNLSGSFKAIVDQSAPVPGIPNAYFSSFGPAQLRDGKAAFAVVQFHNPSDPGHSFVPGNGVYIANASSGAVTRVADTTMPRPGGGNFGDLLSAAFDGTNVAFQDEGTSPGIYADIGGTLRLVADTNTLIPGSNVPFGRFFGVAIGNGRVVFGGDPASGVADGQTGVYLWDDGVISPILRRGDLLDGRTVLNMSFNNESMDGDHLAIQVGTTGIGSIYETTVPEPGAFGLVGLAAAALMRRRR